MATKHRPRRGDSGRNVLVTGDTGPRQPQHGAEPGATESGDLAAREYGVPQADLPGGVAHLVNPEAPPAETPKKAERPADYHKYHGVPSDDGQYTVPERVIKQVPRAVPEPEYHDAVPVYLTAGPGKKRKQRTFIAGHTITLAPGDYTVRRLCDQDLGRVWLMIYQTNNLLIGQKEDLDAAVAVGTPPTGQGGGFVLTQGAGQGNKMDIQNELWVVNAAIATATPSYGICYLTETEVSGL